MKLVLVGFSQDMRLADDGGSMKNYLLFETEDGKEERIPVGEETVRAVMALTVEGEKAEERKTAAAEPAGEEEIPEFGGDVGGPDSDDQDDAPQVYELAGDPKPTTESEVPSV